MRLVFLLVPALLLLGCSFIEEGLVPSLTGEAPPDGALPRAGPQEAEAPPLDPEGPFLLVRFGEPPPAWRAALEAGALKVLRERPQARFEVRSLTPGKGDPAALAQALFEAGARGQEVYRALVLAGVPPEQISLLAASNGNLALPEVRIYLR